MRLKNINIAKIKILDSSFYFSWLFKDKVLKNFKADWLKIKPVICHQVNLDEYELITGFEQLLNLENLNEEIPVVILSKRTARKELIQIFLMEYLTIISDSVISKIRFIAELKQKKITNSDLQEICLLLELGFSLTRLKDYLKIAQFSEVLLDFCHDKQLGLKQCFQLSVYPKEIIDFLLIQKQKIALSSSLFLELASWLYDLSRRLDKFQFSAFLQDKRFVEILDSDLNPHEKAKRFREIIYQLVCPTLIDLNNKAQSIKDKMDLASGINLTWDPTFEKPELNLNLKIKSVEDFEQFLMGLNKKKFKTKLQKLISKL